MARPQALARAHLERRLGKLRPLASQPRPHKGWIRAIREALGMTTAELGARMGLSQQAASDLEHRETHGSVTLGSLRRAAEALDCDLVYALVPRATLDEAVRAQARRQAARHLGRVAHHSRLEDQAVADEDTDAQLDDLAAQFVDRRGLWTEHGSSP